MGWVCIVQTSVVGVCCAGMEMAMGREAKDREDRERHEKEVMDEMPGMAMQG